MSNKIKAYGHLMRFDRPVGIFLLLWPTLWAVWIAGNGRPNWFIVMIFVAGVVIMRAAGCVINDLVDRKFDVDVKRTAKRPLVTGTVSVKHAILLAASLCFIAFCLVLQLNLATVGLAILALCLSTLYPFMKRYTYFPQVVLGMAWYVGLLMAFTAQQDSLPNVAWLLYLTVILWTVVYDTFYAMADREDDVRIGIKSTAILFGRWDRVCTGVLQVIVLALLVAIGPLWGATAIYYASIVVAAGFFGYQQWLVRDRQPAQCLKAFLNNQYAGLAIFIGIVGSFLI